MTSPESIHPRHSSFDCWVKKTHKKPPDGEVALENWYFNTEGPTAALSFWLSTLRLLGKSINSELFFSQSEKVPVLGLSTIDMKVFFPFSDGSYPRFAKWTENINWQNMFFFKTVFSFKPGFKRWTFDESNRRNATSREMWLKYDVIRRNIRWI